MWSNYFHTLRYLRPGQIVGRITHRLQRPTPDLRPAPDRARLIDSWREPCSRPESLFADHTARFLNVQRRIETPHGWNDPAIEKLWLYNLHYFEGLLAPGNAEQANSRTEWVKQWIKDNPPGKGNGWEPYPLSLRITNWIKWILNGAQPTQEILHSLAVQTRYLTQRLEHHLLGNHLFENAKALIAAGRFFAGDEAARWYDLGQRIMQAQLKEQLLDDGGHYERSPMYHALLLEGLLDLHNLHLTTTGDSTSPWARHAARMLDWLRRLCHPDGGIAFFNDAAFGIAPTLAQLNAYAERLCLSHPTAPSDGTDWLGHAGYARLERPSVVVIADVAPIGPDYMPGHAHADSLSFECSIAGQRVLVNGGTSTYASGAERQRQRSTAAHNTVCIDKQDSSEVWGGFRVARRARTHIQRFDVGPETHLEGWHDGYRRLRGKPVHRRRWSLGADMLVISDEVQTRRRCRIEAHYHFHPSVTLRAQTDRSFEVLDEHGKKICVIEIDGPLVWQIIQETWHPGFGISIPSTGLCGIADETDSMRWLTHIRWKN